MDVEAADLSLAAVAGAIADPSRSIMLCALLDGRARTATELAALADIASSTASGHFARLREQGLVQMHAQGRHRYYRLSNTHVARALEALLSITDRGAPVFRPSTPCALKQARTCYDHCAGEISVKVHDAMLGQGWIQVQGKDYALTDKGADQLAKLGIEVDCLVQQRRRLAYPCMDWSERTPHLGGALGAALLELMLKRDWVSRHLDSRALTLTARGATALAKTFGA
ncbi:ArsR/SmtB family transcription factor [Pseudomonas sp. TWR2-1-1]|uniref:ArsR/SmtB family transcription factor n=1 Tax=Pseudomonas sp. TWR2-1-1 TaxID=2804610 RepID=UPI003CF93AEF